jgi:hypothetical protein
MHVVDSHMCTHGLMVRGEGVVDDIVFAKDLFIIGGSMFLVFFMTLCTWTDQVSFQRTVP